MKTNLLGKSTSKLRLKGLKILDVIERNKSSIKHGIDIWNVYDFLYSNRGIPALKILEIKIPSSSPFLIESKSMKLYLNGFYNKSFNNDIEILELIKNELESRINTELSIKFINKFNKEPSFLNLNKYKNKTTKKNKIIKFNGFRSICPVTSQPDFANIFIYCDVPIVTNWLLNYLISFQNKGDFHEQCIESIYLKIMDKYTCNHLEVCGRFQRRGGIDINPIRGNKKSILFSNFRELNQ
ncbi:MAG: 7-cyano-7-deazaguanine reductase [Gammaproteobacteria bacterium]|nr:7-cyano-7-deazaguanine reductase [Gammaproteobacteria bacterium]